MRTKRLTTPIKEKPTPVERNADQDIKDIISDCIDKGQKYRDISRPIWDEIEAQIQQVPPLSWADKEPWQSRVYLPLQANGSETGFSKFKKILFSGTKMVDVAGVEPNDKKKILALLSLTGALMTHKFEIENDSVLQEAVDFGGSFLKVLANRAKDGLEFTYRSVYNCLFDPKCGNNFGKARWWIDEYDKDIGDLIDEVKKSTLYDKEVVKKMVNDAEHQVTISEPSLADKDLATIRSYDGTANIQIPAAFKKILFYEWWGLMKVPGKQKAEVKKKLEDVTDYTNEWRVITMARMGSKDYILRNNDNEYGGIPAFLMVLKPKKLDAIGNGYLKNGMGVQELGNSTVNLGFDDEKINTFGEALVNINAVAKGMTIERGPNKMLFVNDLNGIKLLSPKGQSTLPEKLRGVGFLDQLYQDATTLTRQTQGSYSLQGQGSPETLGEYQSKLQLVDDKFLAQAKIVESRYIKPMFIHIYKIITNPKLFTQAACDRILGVDIITEQRPKINPDTGQPFIDPNTNQPVIEERQIKKPRLVLKDLDPDVELDYRLIGVTQMQEILQIKEQLTQILELAAKFPAFMELIKPEGLLRNMVNAIRFNDPDSIIKTEEEVAKERQEREQGQVAQLQMKLQQLLMIIQKAGIKLPGLPPQGGNQPQQQPVMAEGG